jgi:ribonucleotide reductase alpha subunit
MFLDDSACNLASINLTKYLGEDGTWDIEGYRHAIRTLITAQEILVDFCSYPTQPIAQNSHDFRPLGLGYANLGSALMIEGIPYDSEEGRQTAAALTSILCGHAYRTSAEIAATKNPFPGYEINRDSMLEVIGMHREASYQINPKHCPADLLKAAQEDWDDALKLGEVHGFRNAQSTVLAPTGTIGLLMDCDTTGIEPDFALVKFKKLAGGGYFKIINHSVPNALKRLGYSARKPERRAARQPREPQDQGLHRKRIGEDRGLSRSGLRSQPGFLGLEHRGAGDQSLGRLQGQAQGSPVQPAASFRLQYGADPGGGRRDLRADDDRGGPASQSGASPDLRLRQ